MTIQNALLTCVAAFAGWVCVVLIGFNWNRMRLRKISRALPLSTRRRILEQIDRAGADDADPVLLLRPATEDWPAAYVGSWIGGAPELSSSANWPRDSRSDGPARFLAQIALQSPPLAACWSARSVALFCVDAVNNTVRAVSVDTPLMTTPHNVTATPLSVIWLPSAVRESRDGAPRYAGDVLLGRCPSLEAELRQHAAQPARLLPYVLLPDAHTWQLDSFMVNLMGGEPELIQGEHDATCPACRTPMQFLFQVGDVLGLAGDAPVVYVYGCQAHRAEVATFVDLH